VDDQRQVRRMLRMSLELSGHEYEVVEATSGEEALQAFDEAPVALVVTDLRLPGISGLELLEEVKRANPEASAILITGHPTDEVRSRAEALGVISFLRKPIGTNAFLEAVERTLYPRVEGESPVEVGLQDQPDMAERLATLRRELGAEAVLLVDDSARVTARAGDLADLDFDSAMPSLVTAFTSGLKISSILGSLLPLNFQYFDGEAHDVYVTNVGAYFALVIAFRGGQGVGQMGSVVHFGRRAADEILSALSQLGVPSEPDEAPGEAEPAQEEPIPEIPQADLEAASNGVQKDEADRFWDEAVLKSKSDQAEGDALTYEQAKKLGLLNEDEDG
jgi:two-component system chemotaxis response regulator CheY